MEVRSGGRGRWVTHAPGTVTMTFLPLRPAKSMVEFMSPIRIETEGTGEPALTSAAVVRLAVEEAVDNVSMVHTFTPQLCHVPILNWIWGRRGARVRGEVGTAKVCAARTALELDGWVMEREGNREPRLKMAVGGGHGGGRRG